MLCRLRNSRSCFWGGDLSRFSWESLWLHGFGWRLPGEEECFRIYLFCGHRLLLGEEFLLMGSYCWWLRFEGSCIRIFSRLIHRLGSHLRENWRLRLDHWLILLAACGIFCYGGRLWRSGCASIWRLERKCWAWTWRSWEQIWGTWVATSRGWRGSTDWGCRLRVWWRLKGIRGWFVALDSVVIL